MPEKEVVTPAGFLDASIDIDGLAGMELAFVRSAIVVWEEGSRSPNSVPLLVGAGIKIPLRPGKYKVQATLESVTSETVDIEIKAGETEKVVFFFGKK
jgi:hypothetical protein